MTTVDIGTRCSPHPPRSGGYGMPCAREGGCRRPNTQRVRSAPLPGFCRGMLDVAVPRLQGTLGQTPRLAAVRPAPAVSARPVSRQSQLEQRCCVLGVGPSARGCNLPVLYVDYFYFETIELKANVRLAAGPVRFELFFLGSCTRRAQSAPNNPVCRKWLAFDCASFPPTRGRPFA